MAKFYLGDSVYVDVRMGSVVLTTENGVGASNTIWLEPMVWECLVRYVDRQNEGPVTHGYGAFDSESTVE